MLSPHPADPTLTTDNLMEVVKGVEDRWDDLGDWLDLPDSKRDKIRSLYHSHQHRMQALADYYTTHHPTRSWNKVAAALQEVGLHKQADEVTTKYVKGMEVNHAGMFTCQIWDILEAIYQYWHILACQFWN